MWAESRRFKEPQQTRMELAILLTGFRRVKNKYQGLKSWRIPWLADAWQAYCYPVSGYCAKQNVYRAGVRYMLSRPRLRKYYDEPFAADICDQKQDAYAAMKGPEDMPDPSYPALTEGQRNRTIEWFNSLRDHFMQTYIFLLAPGGLVELDPPHRASMLNRGGTGKVTNEDGFVSWLYHCYTKEIEGGGKR